PPAASAGRRLSTRSDESGANMKAPMSWNDCTVPSARCRSSTRRGGGGASAFAPRPVCCAAGVCGAVVAVAGAGVVVVAGGAGAPGGTAGSVGGGVVGAGGGVPGVSFGLGVGVVDGAFAAPPRALRPRPGDGSI